MIDTNYSSYEKRKRKQPVCISAARQCTDYKINVIIYVASQLSKTMATLTGLLIKHTYWNRQQFGTYVR